MQASSLTAPERARKIVSLVLQRVNGDATQAALAVAIGTSAPTVNRLLNDHLEKFALVLAHCGLKVVPSTHRCVDERTFEAFELLWERAMRSTSPRQLIFENDE